MSATTSLKLSEELKQRTVMAAKNQGLSTHAFMLKAIDQAAKNVELRTRFFADARTARKELLENDRGYDVDDVHEYLREKIADEHTGKPEARSWQK
jgi:predicted DNA-binding protein